MNTPTLPQLYAPSAAEITAVANSAKCRHPHLASRIDKAAELLTTGALQLDAAAWDVRQLVRWKVASQSGKGSYVVCGTSCPCQDKRTPHCKHAIAVTLLLKILNNRINADIRARDIDLGILPDHTFNAYANRLGMVHLRKLGMSYTFCDSASAVRFSMWAARAVAPVRQLSEALTLALAA